MDDAAHMRAALALAERNLGTTWPNPSVGCVIVRDGRVVGRGSTQPGGRPHAETVALARAGERARGATAYVTLEPCCHWGKTPPCTGALIEAGVRRVVVGMRDPDPRVDGGGIAALRAAGVEVVDGVEAEDVSAVLAGFVMRVRAGRPLVTLKLASTLDGRIATSTGESRWITGEAARRVTQALRGRHDAVMVGIGTVLADDPDLTCRLPGFRARAVVRVVVDSGLRTPVSARVLAGEAPTWLLAHADADAERQEAIEERGGRVIRIEPHPGPLQQAGALGNAGLTSVLVEGGAGLAASLLRAGLVDRIAWFHAPALAGEDGLPAIRDLGVARLADWPRFRRRSVVPVGDDVLTMFDRAA